MRRGRFRIGITTEVDSAYTERYTVHKSGGTSITYGQPPIHVPGAVVPSRTVIINDPGFVTLTAERRPMFPTRFCLVVKANNSGLPVEVSYLILDPSGTPAHPSQGMTVHPTADTQAIQCPPAIPGPTNSQEIKGQQFFHTEVGGWENPRFHANPQSFLLPHDRTCVLLLARYEHIYTVFLREHEGQLTYKVLKGGTFNGLQVPGLGEVTREGSSFKIRSFGPPVEVGLWAAGKYLHDEVNGWELPEYKGNPKLYKIPHYGMFMLMIARYDKVGLIIGNENDGQLGTICIVGSYDWEFVPQTVSGLCTITRTGAHSGREIEVKAITEWPVEVSQFSFSNSCWQWEVSGWEQQKFVLDHYTPGFLMTSGDGNKVGVFFYNENDGQLGVLPLP